MVRNVHLIYLLFGIIISHIILDAASFQIPQILNTRTSNIAVGKGKVMTLFMINEESFSISPSSTIRSLPATLSTQELFGPFNSDFVKYMSYIDILNIHLNAVYDKSCKIKCPFFRRRATDIMDSIASIFQFVLVRHKSFPINLSVLGSEHSATYQSSSNSKNSSCASSVKLQGLTISEISDIIREDWKGRMKSYCTEEQRTGKGYYITGKLTHGIYREDCYFDGPDPDMPVTGLKKYISSTSQLFNHKSSRADILSLSVDEKEKAVIVTWRLEGILNLPWHPHLKPWTGSTTYYIDQHGLIDRHIETWDISVLDAFISTLFPFLHFGQPRAPPL